MCYFDHTAAIIEVLKIRIATYQQMSPEPIRNRFLRRFIADLLQLEIRLAMERLELFALAAEVEMDSKSRTVTLDGAE